MLRAPDFVALLAISPLNGRIHNNIDNYSQIMNHHNWRVLHATNDYSLSGCLENQFSLHLRLRALKSAFVTHSFSGSFRIQDLPEIVRLSFKTMRNVESFLMEPSHCQIHINDGIIVLQSPISLPNDKSLILETGRLVLSREESKRMVELQEITPILASNNELANSEIKQVLTLIVQVINRLTDDISCPTLSGSTFYDSLRHQRRDSIQKTPIINSDILIPSPANCFNEQEQRVTQQIRADHKDDFNAKQQYIQFQEKVKIKIEAMCEQMRKESLKIQSLAKNIKQMRDLINSSPSLEEMVEADINDYAHIVVSEPTSSDFDHPTKKKEVFTYLEHDSKSPEKKEKNSHIEDFIDITATYVSQFRVRNNVATYIGQDWTKTQLLGRVKISERSEFNILIKKTKRRYIWLGVVDSSYRNRRWSWGNPNWIYYCGWNGKVYQGPDQSIKSEGTGYKQGDKVCVKVNLEKGYIQWQVNGVVKASHQTDKLKEAINWVPLIKFFDSGDTVAWID